MKAISVIPGEKNSLHLRDVPVPNFSDNELLIRSVYTGVCSTDREICEGLYGTAPIGKDYLILGHESFGVVEKIGKNVSGFKKGEYVVRFVRRPCNNCDSCKSGANDMCSTGNFIESGIKGLEGCMAEYFIDSSNYLIQIPSELADIGVLLEPLSVVEKALRQTKLIQQRLLWKPKQTFVIGAGPIGILQTMLLVEQDIETYVIARSLSGNLKSQLVEKVGAHYISNFNESLENIAYRIGKPDLIIEASGDSRMGFEAMKILGNNGILCFTSVTGGDKKIEILSDKINLDFVLGNKLVFGTVNANRVDYLNGVKSLERFMQKWPDVLYSMLTRRVKLFNYKDAFEVRKEDIKTVIEF